MSLGVGDLGVLGSLAKALGIFLAVWQNVPDEPDSEPIYRVLDEMIKNWP